MAGTAVLAACSVPTGTLQAQDAARVDKVEKENAELKKRLETLENLAKKEGILTSAEGAKMPV